MTTQEPTYSQLAQALSSARACPYRSYPERHEAVMDELVAVVLATLRKLSVDAGESPGQPPAFNAREYVRRFPV